jgi:hypothetical protein
VIKLARPKKANYTEATLFEWNKIRVETDLREESV